MIVRSMDIQAVFFDLDGTLIDSAADLVAAMNRLRAEVGEAPADSAAVGQVVSKGGRAMLRRGFPGADEARIEALLPRFLQLYSENIAIHTRAYPGIEDVLSALETRGIRWGIVTNKPGHLARAVVARAQVGRSAAQLWFPAIASRSASPILRRCCAPVRWPESRPCAACMWATTRATSRLGSARA